MFRNLLFITILTFAEGVCFYDNTPPSFAELHDDRPGVIFRLEGFAPAARVAVRFWDESSAWTRPASMQTFTDTQGGYIGFFSVAKGNGSASYLLYVDQNNNGRWDVGDFGVYRASVLFPEASAVVEETITYSSGTLVEYLPGSQIAHNAPTSGVTACIYMPFDQSPWSEKDRNSVAEFPVMDGTTLLFSDWFPVGEIDPASVVSSTFLPSGSYHETCIVDLNANGRINKYDAVGNPGVVVLP